MSNLAVLCQITVVSGAGDYKHPSHQLYINCTNQSHVCRFVKYHKNLLYTMLFRSFK